MQHLARNNQRVLIVGGGPAGMLLALELSLFGIRPRIIAKHSRWSPHSKATIVWPGVLEILERTGITEKLLSEAHYFDAMNYYSNKKLVGNIRFDTLKYTAYPFGVTIPQWKTERILEETLNERGMLVEYGYEFISGQNKGDNVEVILKNPQGEESKEVYGWLVGADGFSSQVRSTFGFQFNGYEMKTRLAITDTEILSEATSSEVGYYLHKTGNMVLAPLGDGIFRVGASIPSDYVGKIDRDFFNQLLKTRVPGNKQLGDIKFCGEFNTHVRSVDTLRKDRVFLVGDAAHAMSPSGAQGLNCGFHDVVNLGWKLAGVINQDFEAPILNSYSSERLSGIQQITKVSTFLANVSLYKNRFAILARDAIFKVASKTKLINKYFSPRIAQLNIPLNDAINNQYTLTVGKRMPLQWIKKCAGLSMSVQQFTVLLWPGKNYGYFEWCSFQDRISTALNKAHCLNLAGKFIGQLRSLLSEKPLCVVVRPDGYISKVIDINDYAHEDVIRQVNAVFSMQSI